METPQTKRLLQMCFLPKQSIFMLQLKSSQRKKNGLKTNGYTHTIRTGSGIRSGHVEQHKGHQNISDSIPGVWVRDPRHKPKSLMAELPCPLPAPLLKIGNAER